MKLDLDLTPKQKEILANLIKNYMFVYHNGKLTMEPIAAVPIIVYEKPRRE